MKKDDKDKYVKTTVLIETLWNVNISRSNWANVYVEVLIETLWNVNVHQMLILLHL